MLYVIHQKHPELTYQGGQASILHFEADLNKVLAWNQSQTPALRWAFTDSNAGSVYFDDYNDLTQLDKIDWVAVQARYWQTSKEGKQAEFLMEKRFPWHLIDRIGVHSQAIYTQVVNLIANQTHQKHKPKVEILPDWYY